MSDVEPTPYERMRALGASHAVIAAYDILADAGYSPIRSAAIAVGAERLGKDPEEFARHMVKLKAAQS